ncbi:hypothetical protein EN742_04425 [Mesorhizobium sp. M4A.F.Ca.ET.020.02.1.1]|uniref:hypothetical protein n=1 Tax=unclassified Mesorhizobium TaxID=325217 RepID=UPI000FC9ED99|nr:MULTISPECIES: hypothetical protein [unclassified Mesorhizobium]RUX51808.1 hypothetical protein EOA33_04850 [Mesorhizobium sp. M4A.F.Ca.ET.050.02.1.1]RVD43674.1 hypothetical protein EN742_04425 [Mesorhizobium sp. M4A.F.Ca.ET.020.02.1.1]RWC11615.1 MAG: hypothetical protein EOS53_27105 [Mesorhizobium sp.]RWD22560.1 MAG: hypothetical protein EOS33_27775 [Mesorhizobium sp.]RWD31212.1 MAG: hypothetical protein EOS22_05235 [Mesorhizobium sp.]
MRHPALTEWPIWHDDPWNDQQGYGALQRHDIALARYLAKQQADRASVVRRLDLWAAMTRAAMLVAGVGRTFFLIRRPCDRNVGPANNAMSPINSIALTLLKSHAEFSKTFWGR